VLISGSRATELANETTFNGRRYGAMTWHLARALGSAGERSTYRSVMDEVAAEVNSRYPSQHPQIEGPGMDLKIFSADRINTVPYVPAEPRGGDHVEISAGGIHGLSEGSELEVYPPEAVDFAKHSPVAKVVLTSVGDFAATAVVTEGGPVAPGSKAVVSAVVHGDARVPVYVDAARHGLLNPVARALDRYGAVRLVETVYSARLMVTVEDRSVMIKSGDLELMVPPVPLADPGVEDRVVRQVQDIVHWLNIIDLHSPSGAIDVEFDVRRSGDPPGSTAPAAVHPGTQLTYRVRNRDEAPLYVYVLDASSDGSVALLYPRVSGAQEELPPGGTLERSIEMFLPEGHSEVTDVLKVIATTRPIDPSVFPQGAIRGAAVSDALDPQDPLAAFLARSLRGLSRGGRPVEVNSWATLQRRVVVGR
jgi:hypothetical protein